MKKTKIKGMAMARMSSQKMEAKLFNSTVCSFQNVSLVLSIFLAFGLLVKVFASEKWIRNDLKIPNPQIYIDYWSGRDQSSFEPVTDFYVEIHPADFVIRTERNGFSASYQISISIYDAYKQLVAEDSQSEDLLFKSYSQTQENNQNHLHKFRFNLDSGEYKALIKITDKKINKNATIEKEFRVLSTNDFPSEVSDILFLREEIENANSSRILPYPYAVYGVDQSNLFCYFELYQQKSALGDSLDLTISYINQGNQQVVLRTVNKKLGQRRFANFHRFYAGDIPPGEYRLKVSAKLKNSGIHLESEKKFVVYQSQTDLRFNDFDQVLKELSLIADKEELNSLEKTPESNRQQAVNEFWQKLDPTPETVANELKSEFYSRVNIAKKYFWHGSKQSGWFTDQGKTYIKYGKPDKAIRGMDYFFSRTKEIWQYSEPSFQVVFLYDPIFRVFNQMGGH